MPDVSVALRVDAVCNKHNSADLASIDPETGEMQRLFNPRRDQWREHFDLRALRSSLALTSADHPRLLLPMPVYNKYSTVNNPQCNK